ncbi:MAG: hypothetical protein KJS64_06140, partial [Acidobacteria bacterium]|nr:hypothetical protein [Acidobacteriota bacterium]
PGHFFACWNPLDNGSGDIAAAPLQASPQAVVLQEPSVSYETPEVATIEAPTVPEPAPTPTFIELGDDDVS